MFMVFDGTKNTSRSYATWPAAGRFSIAYPWTYKSFHTEQQKSWINQCLKDSVVFIYLKHCYNTYQAYMDDHCFCKTLLTLFLFDHIKKTSRTKPFIRKFLTNFIFTDIFITHASHYCPTNKCEEIISSNYSHRLICSYTKHEIFLFPADLFVSSE